MIIYVELEVLLKKDEELKELSEYGISQGDSYSKMSIHPDIIITYRQAGEGHTLVELDDNRQLWVKDDYEDIREKILSASSTMKILNDFDFQNSESIQAIKDILGNSSD